MLNYDSAYYDEHRNIIKRLRQRKEWDFIRLFSCENEDELEEKLQAKIDDGEYPENLDAQLWIKLVEYMESAENESEIFSTRKDNQTMLGKGAVNTMKAPTYEYSNWILYKNKLVNDGWTSDSIEELERSTLKILHQLSIDTANRDPIKGLVVGNVQSGKTANMAALMAMAADWGWNMFIVLSGTIDNLRKQTEERLIGDLNYGNCNLSWKSHRHVKVGMDKPDQTQSLHFNENSRERYLSVCLKNKTRLRDLYNWLTEDQNQLLKMKILIIDDEADQGSVNTNDLSKKDRTEINKAIVRLVDIKTESGHKPAAMNYISYTATPYANFLNEAVPESLYPKEFIGLLNPAKEYFGPKQIFGLEESEIDLGIPIIREIYEEDYKHILAIHDEEEIYLPKSFKKAIAWFICSTAAMRYRKYIKPISMLVHTSQKQHHHTLINEAIEAFFREYEGDKLVDFCEQIYAEEIKKFDLTDFENEFSTYPLAVKDYPEFEKIREGIVRLGKKVSYIKMEGEDRLPTYHEGIQICVDNCSNNRIDDEGNHLRLMYPTKKPGTKGYPSPAPAFIIIGGSTLSRGLTIEGLVSTYFLRTTKQADTLMQMGRWFGYRKGYEMFPRIWMTEDTRKKFVFLATLEEELRNELVSYAYRGMDAESYGPKIKNSPKLSWMKITAKNKMRGAIVAELDFSGTSNQTIYFDNEKKILEENIKITEAFISMLSNPKDTQNGNGVYWENVEFNLLADDFLRKFNFNKNSAVFSQMNAFIEWYQEKAEEAEYTNWNVVVAGKKNKEKDDSVWNVAGREIVPINRSRKERAKDKNDIINIGVLRDPKDLYADVEEEKIKNLSSEFLAENDFNSNKVDVIRNIREEVGLGKTPQLLIYKINNYFDPIVKDPEKPKRFLLDTQADIIGVSIFIPGVPVGSSLAAKLTIDISNGTEDPLGDVES